MASGSHAEANRSAFNALASSYNSQPWQLQLSTQISIALRSRLQWLHLPDLSKRPGLEVRLLDYACGTGSITAALASSVTTIRGIDLSENMVSAYNATAQTSGLDAKAVVADLLAPTEPEELSSVEWRDFDLAVIGLGFHHFADPVLAVRRLSERLKVGTGVLCIIDFLPFAPKTPAADTSGVPDAASTVKHHGFTSAGLERLFVEAGLEDFAFEVLDETVTLEFKDGGKSERKVFIAKGRRAPTVLGKVWRWVEGYQDAVSGQMGPKVETGGWDAGIRKDRGDGQGSRMVQRKDEGGLSGVGRKDEPFRKA